MRIVLAIKVFFAALFNGAKASRLADALVGEPALPKAEPKQQAAPKPTQPKPKKPSRSEAITLLATLQREARFVDIVQEPLDQYNDAQIGAAARDVLRDCGEVLRRLFDLHAIVEGEEGQSIETPEKFDPGRYRLTGNVAGEPPFSGELVHHGWEARKCELPKWTGSDDSARIVAPVELELK